MNAIERRKNWILVCTLAVITIVVNSTAQFKYTFLQDDPPPRRVTEAPMVQQPTSRSEIETRFVPVSAPAQAPIYITKAAVREEPRTSLVTSEPDPELEFVSEMAPVETTVYPTVTRPKEPRPGVEKETLRNEEKGMVIPVNVAASVKVSEKENSATNAPSRKVASSKERSTHRFFGSPRQRDTLRTDTSEDMPKRVATPQEKSISPTITGSDPGISKRPVARFEISHAQERKPHLSSFWDNQPAADTAEPHLFSLPHLTFHSRNQTKDQDSPDTPAQQPQRGTGDKKVPRGPLHSRSVEAQGSSQPQQPSARHTQRQSFNAQQNQAPTHRQLPEHQPQQNPRERTVPPSQQRNSQQSAHPPGRK